MNRVRKFSYAVVGSVLLLGVLSYSGCDSSCAYVVTDGLGTFSLPYCNSPRAVFEAACEHGERAQGAEHLYTTPGTTLCIGNNNNDLTDDCDNGYVLRESQESIAARAKALALEIPPSEWPNVEGECVLDDGGLGGGTGGPETGMTLFASTAVSGFDNFIKSVPTAIGGNHFIFTYRIGPLTSPSTTGMFQQSQINVHQLHLDDDMGNRLTQLNSSPLIQAVSTAATTDPIPGDIIIIPDFSSNFYVITGHANDINIRQVSPTVDMMSGNVTSVGFFNSQNFFADPAIDNPNSHLYSINQLETFTDTRGQFLFISGTNENGSQDAITVYQLRGNNPPSYEAKFMLPDTLDAGHTLHEVHGLTIGTDVSAANQTVIRLHIAISTQAPSGMYSYGIITTTLTPDLDNNQGGTFVPGVYTSIQQETSLSPSVVQSGITKAEIGDPGSERTFLFFATAALNSIYVFEDTGMALSSADGMIAWASDSSARWIGGASSPAFDTHKGIDYFLAAGPEEIDTSDVDDGFSVFRIEPFAANSRPNVQHAFSSSAARSENPDPMLADIVSLDTIVINDAGNDRLFVVAGSSASNSGEVNIRVYEITVP